MPQGPRSQAESPGSPSDRACRATRRSGAARPPADRRLQRAFRLAQAENLRALLVDEQTIATLTPEFLALKFQRQQELANAQQQEIQALVDYNGAIAQLWQAMGTGLQMNRVELQVTDGGAG